MTSLSASAGLGGLNVQSHLGEPFTGSITVTGEEAQALLNGGKATISNGNLRAAVRKLGDKAVVTIRSSKAIKDPVLVFQVGVGAQSREYTAIIDPAGYDSKDAASVRTRPAAESQSSEPTRNAQQPATKNNKAAGNQATQARKDAQRKAEKKQVQTTPAKNDTAVRLGRQHLVRTGETLIAIASSIRPQGMTLDQTIQALVNANPDVFIDNNANRMLAGKVLNIPNRSELQRLAASAPVKTNTAVEKGNETANATEAKTEKPVVQPEVQTEAQVKDAGVNTQQQEEVKQASAEQTEQAASATVNENASSTVPTSDIQEAMASDAQENVVASEPVATTDSVAEQTESESDGNLWKWLLVGGAALIAAWLLLKAAGKRKDELEAAPVSRKDEEKAVQKNVAASAAAVAATKVMPSEKTQDGLLIEDDFEDDVVINEVEESSNVDDVKLDLGKIDHSQAGILSGAVTQDVETEQRRHADWDNIESTESVYEPEPENPYQPVSVVMPERNEEPLEFTVETPENSDDHALPFDVKQDQDVQIQETKEEAEKEEAASEFVIEEGALEWEDEDVSVAADKSNSERGFVSESVGMTAPLEAKYDLAKMYIEIGDPEAARETLQGLIEEAEGDILYKAQKLMKELGA
ncbi:TPA: FimV/HubP family polar landmark protein [Neisseria subflava]|uniref:FimV/HubP family polar landmark protein n=2 Tax=Neisseria TaxID=482 RepID=UPI0008CA09E1|nr:MULTISPECIES: FimV/HubP family polar landmark protein [unclassified Neisseria]OFK82295.1 TspA protein [Neisseria sp. HMSC061E12]OFP80012.1 TspA protein [Neisseria sp. HMSC066B07]OHO84014.1 TspA protein [Neisseria sp. HMSC056A04]OHQ28519.1 TspA protein [Neisseria sp. HMSC066F04]